MGRLERLLQKCWKLKEPGAGTAQEYYDALRDLGHQFLKLYLQKKIKIGEDAIQVLTADDLLNIRGFIKETEKYFPDMAENKKDTLPFTEAIASCLTDFYTIIQESNKGYHVSYYYYRGDNDPKGVPGAMADLILKIFYICSIYDIDIETVLIEKYELYKKKYNENEKAGG